LGVSGFLLPLFFGEGVFVSLVIGGLAMLAAFLYLRLREARRQIATTCGWREAAEANADRVEAELAALKAPRKRDGGRGMPIARAATERAGEAIWVCGLPAICNWAAPIGKRRPVHTRAQHEKLLHAANLGGGGGTIPAPSTPSEK
jgi:hypothetical protein